MLIARAHRRWSLLAGTLLGAVLATSALAQDDLRQRALALASEGRCPAALPLLRDPSVAPDAETHLALALCENAEGRPAAALEAILAARDAGFESAPLALQEGIAQFHLGDPAAAESALARAEAGGAHLPETLLYKGLVALALRRSAAAADALETARHLDPDHVEPVASYYAGLARRQLGQASRAREALERVQREWPGTPWSAEAERALAGGGGPIAPWLWVELGTEYDDNVVLRGAGVRLPEELHGQRDTRFVWRLETGSTLWTEGPWALGGLFHVDGSIHDDLHDFDVTQPAVSLWLDRTLDADTLLRAELTSSYAWVDSDPFRLSQTGALSVHRVWDGSQATTLRAGFHRDDYKFTDGDVPDGPGATGAFSLDPGDLVCSPPGVDESRARNRDGNGLWVGLLHQVQLGRDATAWGALRLRRFSARGREYSFGSQELELGVQVGLPASFDLELSGRYARRSFRHPTTFPEPDEIFAGVEYGLRSSDRRERDLRTRVVLGRPLGRRLRVEARWIHERVRSTAQVFDYRRDFFGGYLILALGSSESGDS
ncbi:MAG: hypothetical protein CL910_09660 [Deltaproteobacteria bacterium]|nr:hypothetical protein [Deltaproteobacteria bacterium]